MGWSIGYDPDWKRDIGYGVPAICDHPDCDEEIDRGLSYVCGGEPYGGDVGCGLFCCATHLYHTTDVSTQRCERCCEGKEPFEPKSDVAEWIQHKLTDSSWQQWRDKNPHEVERLEPI